MIFDDRLPFIQWHDFLLMSDGQLVHFLAPKSHNAKEIVFKKTHQFIAGQKNNYCGPEVHLMTRREGLARDR